MIPIAINPQSARITPTRSIFHADDDHVSVFVVHTSTTESCDPAR